MSFKNKNILIIGASSGIGLSLASSLQKLGANLYLASRSRPNVAGDFNFIELDVEDFEDELNVLPDEIHGFAYCPGTINLKPFQRLKEEDFLKDFRINTLGAVKVVQKILKKLKAAKGASIVFFTTVAVNTGMSFHASVASSKGALQAIGLSLAAELASSKIRVNSIAPSLTDTPLASNLLSSDEKREASNKRHPIGRYGRAEDVTNAALFLLDDSNSWITAQVLGIDGGMGKIKNI